MSYLRRSLLGFHTAKRVHGYDLCFSGKRLERSISPTGVVDMPAWLQSSSSKERDLLSTDAVYS